ncbi:hypothetical protein GOEFS_070_00020 [Gordonia effusa NBRC 100432]|uniref:Uncharacterized protein n=1 Tax=Gordonia effusa NBRC 100432 TaxID=1077974 RepID=H0R1G7_9ACTN|nr:hypothetical protein [Gordonia effusa]GAB18918.1 hypothetical protein GOEFS_070_00020 [Gordonia effusa NBRC 100432]
MSIDVRNERVAPYTDVVIIEIGDPVTLGVSDDKATLRFGEEPKKSEGYVGRRLLFLDGEPAYELSFWCGTCQFVFRRLEGANRTLSEEELRERLSEDASTLDPAIVDTYGQLLGEGTYLPLLLRIEPKLVTPSGDDDYFSTEQIATWGIRNFWGLPEYPATPYYRTFQTAVDDDSHFFEFVVPMVPPSWNDSARVDDYASRLEQGRIPTAVAVATLDVCAPATDTMATDYYRHWAFTHFLLDGHHKLAAAARSGRPVQLLTLVALDDCLATQEERDRLVEIRQKQHRPRR